MADSTWTSGLEVAPVMDGEHQAQVDLVQDLERAIEGRASREQVETLLQKLIDITDVHFMSEQIQMRESAYPHYAAHLREHERLLEEVKAFRARLEGSEDGELDAELVRGLQRWLRSHIRGMDRRFGEYLAKPSAS
ncbi:MAG: bacteriohemerythrin [Myxococcota bacterium]